MLVFAILQARGGLIGTPKKDVRSAAFLRELASELNKQLPKAVDQETEVTSVTGLEGVLVYNCRLVNLAASEVDVRTLVENLKPQAARNACGSAETRDKFLKQGISLRYSYADKGGAAITSFDVVPGDCGP